MPELVSILIRSMDRPSLSRALDSAAAQTWPAVEIVVVAACGAAHSPLPAEHHGRPLRLVHADPIARLDRPAAANVALAHARGEWLNFLDDDDELLPHHLQTLLEAPRQPGERVVYSRTVVHDEHGRSVGHCGIAGFHAQLYFQNRGHFMATLFHRSLVDEGARFDPAFAVFEDRDFIVNCATRTGFRFVDAVTCVWNAYLGESGLGHGGNADTTLDDRYLPRLREKWKAAFDQWLAQPEALIFLGQHHLRHDGAATALPYLEEALRRRPGDVNALNICGMALLQLGRFDRAEALLRQAVARLPQHPALRANLQLIVDERARAR